MLDKNNHLQGRNFMNIAELFSLKGKVALVTGGGRGIGKFIATGLAEAGADLILTSRKLKNLEATAKELELSLIHISEPTRRTPISYAVFCLKKKKNNPQV